VHGSRRGPAAAKKISIRGPFGHAEIAKVKERLDNSGERK
jgi:hypothetical protein